MLTFLSFVIVMAGIINWLLIGLLQYDFVAGLFGFQSSIFSRLIYIIIGVAGIIFLFQVVKNRGKVNVFNFKFGKKKNKNSEAPHFNNTKSNENYENAYHHKRENDHIIDYDDFNNEK